MTIYRDGNRRSTEPHSNSDDWTLDSSSSETMTAWLERQATNHHVQLAATAVISGIAVAGVIYGTQAARRKAAVDDLKASIPELTENYHAQKACHILEEANDPAKECWVGSKADRLSEAYRFWLCLSYWCAKQGRRASGCSCQTGTRGRL